MQLDAAVARLLDIDPSKASVSSHGGSGFASTNKITVRQSDGSTKLYFMKTGVGSEAEAMFAGEHASLNAISSIVPTLCPRSYGHGKLDSGSSSDAKSRFFLVTEFLTLSSASNTSPGSEQMSLAQKLARLHTSPAPTPEGHSTPQFGFPVPTCCGETPQDNTFTSSWATFFAERRLRFILGRARGADAELRRLVDRTANKVVPRLLGDDHLDHGRGVMPVVVHGDLWSGNKGRGKLESMRAGPEEVIFDSSACYAHSEYDLGIMKMFGGFGGKFLEEYHELCPKTEPVGEYEDRVALYELYHHLNHYAMFGGGYKGGAISIMERLIEKYAPS